MDRNSDLARVLSVIFAVAAVSAVEAAEYRFAKDDAAAIAKVNALELKPGDSVLFERGGLFRGNIKGRPGVTYAAYGEGEMPIVCGSRRDYADAKLWAETAEKGVWRCTEKLHNVGIVLFDHDPRNACEPGVKFAVMKYPKRNEKFTKRVELDENLSFRNLFEVDRLELRCDEGNPGAVFRHIEIGESGHGIRCEGKGFRIRDLRFTLMGCHGVSFGSCKDVEVRDCVFDWLGGSILEGWRFGTVRYGNAVESFGTEIHGFRVIGCRAYEIYDTGVTFQCNDAGTPCHMDDILFESNTVDRCYWGLEYYNARNGEGSYTRHIRWRGNTVTGTGSGWGCLGREESAPVISLAETPEDTIDFVIEGNKFLGSTGTIIERRFPSPEKCYTLRDNVIVQRKGGLIERRFHSAVAWRNNPDNASAAGLCPYGR